MVRSTDSPHPIADGGLIESAGSASGPAGVVLQPGSRLDLQPFDGVLPLLCTDVEARFGRRTRLAPLSIWKRPFSFVMRAGVWHDGDAGPREHLFVKVSKPKNINGLSDAMRKRVEKDFAVTERVFARMSEGHGFGAVRPFACYPGHLAIVTEEVAGETLLELLQREARWSFSASRADRAIGLMTEAGRWIRHFQEPSSETISDTWAETYIDHRLRQIASTGPRGERLRSLVLRHIRHLASRLPAGPVGKVTVHADLSPSNVMVSAGRVVVLDFAMCRLGHPLQDVSRLYTQLDLLAMKPQFRRPVIDALQQALLRGFDPSFDARDPAFRLQLLAQRVNHLASLSSRRYSGLEAIYNRVLCWRHSKWLEREAALGGEGRPWG
jgi:hypothetical protein